MKPHWRRWTHPCDVEEPDTHRCVAYHTPVTEQYVSVKEKLSESRAINSHERKKYAHYTNENGFSTNGMGGFHDDCN